MPVKTFRPLTPSTRYVTFADYGDITKVKPEKGLVDFKRSKHGVEAVVKAIEYDPGRSARLALLEYKDGEKTYIIAPNGLQVGAKLMSGPTAPPEIGNSLPLRTV